MNTVTNTSSGADTVGHEFYDSKVKNVHWDSVSNTPTRQMTPSLPAPLGKFDISAEPAMPTAELADSIEPSTTQGSLSESAHRQNATIPPASSNSVPNANSATRNTDRAGDRARASAEADRPSGSAKAVSDPVTVIKGGDAAATAGAASSVEVPSIDVHAATPAAAETDEDPIPAQSNASSTPTSTEPVQASAAQPEPETAQSTAPAPLAKDNSADAASSETDNKKLPSTSPALEAGAKGTDESTVADLVDLAPDQQSRPAQDPENAVAAIVATPPAESDGWDFHDASDGSLPDASDSGSTDAGLFQDAVVVNVANSDSDDDNTPLGGIQAKLLANKEQSVATPVDKVAGDSKIQNSDTAGGSHSATVSDPSKGTASIAESGAANVLPESTAISDQKNDGGQSRDQGRTETESSGAVTAPSPAASTDVGDSQKEKEQVESSADVGSDPASAAPELKSEQQQQQQQQEQTQADGGGEPAEANATTSAPEDPEVNDGTGGKGEATKEDAEGKAKATDSNEEASGMKKPTLHVNTSGADPQDSQATSADGAGGEAADGEGVDVESSLPKHMQDADGDGTTESETQSGPSSPQTSKKSRSRKKAKRGKNN